jgi:predicted nuclease of predicted toxin-antitoxin system
VPVRLKVDENLPDDIAQLLNANGHDALTIADQGWQGMADDELWARVQAENRWLVTADKDFADIRHYPPGTQVGLVLLRPSEENRATYTQLVAMVLARVRLDEIGGAVIVATQRGVRVRRNS